MGAPLVVLETDGSTPAVVEVAWRPREWGDFGPQIAEIEDEIMAVASSVRAALWGDEALRRRRLAQAAEAQARRARQEGAGPLLAADDAAALLLAAGSRPDGLTVEAQLAQAVAARWRRAPPPGARWARATACSLDIEGERDEGGNACGMGHVPEISQRFLLLWKSSAGP